MPWKPEGRGRENGRSWKEMRMMLEKVMETTMSGLTMKYVASKTQMMNRENQFVSSSSSTDEPSVALEAS